MSQPEATVKLADVTLERTQHAEQAPARKEVLFDVQDLGVSYNGLPALKNVSLQVYKNRVTAFIGPSGCGKSTFLHIMGGFIPADSGTIRVYGAAVNGPGPDRGMMFQEFSLFPWKTVAGNVAWGLEAQGMAKAQVETIVQKYLDIMGLADFHSHYPAEISGGMKQRAALARVLAFDPKVLLMDEPFGALDAQTRETMQEEVTRLWERTKKTIVFVTHDIEEAVFLGDRVVCLSARPGRIRELSRDFPELGQSALYCVTEVHTRADVERLLCAPQMRRCGMDGKGVLVAIVDTGFNTAYLAARGKTLTLDAARSWVPVAGMVPGAAPVGPAGRRGEDAEQQHGCRGAHQAGQILRRDRLSKRSWSARARHAVSGRSFRHPSFPARRKYRRERRCAPCLCSPWGRRGFS